MLRKVLNNLADFLDIRSGLNDNFTFLFDRKISWYPTIAAAKAATLYDGQIIQTIGYYSAGDGGHGTYRFSATSSATEDGGTVHTTTSGGKLFFIPDSGCINIRQFGAKGDGSDDGNAILAVFNYNKSIIAKIIGTPDPRFTKGFTIDFGYGKFKCSKTLPLVNGTHITGGNGYANEDGNLCSVEYTGSTYLFENSSYSGQWNPSTTVYDIDIRGIGWFGKTDLSTSWIKPSSTNSGWKVCNSKIQHCGFRKFKKLDMFLICSHFQWNYMNFMPRGAVYFGGSDTTMSDNVIGGGAYTEGGVTYGSNSREDKLVNLNSWGNSRCDRNYVTGSFGTPAPIPFFVENTFNSQFTDNWYDYTDGPCLIISASRYLVFRGGNLQGASRNPMKSDASGNLWGKYECAILVMNSKQISIDKMLFREIAIAGKPTYKDSTLTASDMQKTVRVWGSSNIHVTDYMCGGDDTTNINSPEYVFSIASENGSTNVTSYALGAR